MSRLTDEDRAWLQKLVDHYETQFGWKQATILKKINARLKLKLSWPALWHDPKAIRDAAEYLEYMKPWIEARRKEEADAQQRRDN